MLAVIIPCYNEADRLDNAAFQNFAAAHSDIHLYFVNDGSRDSTKKAINNICEVNPEKLILIDLAPNRGKAEAVRTAAQQILMQNKYDFMAYWDADLATPLSDIPKFYEVFKTQKNLKVAIGSRVKLLGNHIERKALRHYLGRIFATAASMVLKLAVYDTQCGAKMFRVDDHFKHAFESPFISKWIFDVEILARYLNKLSESEKKQTWIKEIPLDVWRDVDGSKVKPTDFFKAFIELVRIYTHYRIK